MTDLSTITIRRVNSKGIVYGSPIATTDLRWELAEEVAEAASDRSQDSGRVEVGGQAYQWDRSE